MTLNRGRDARTGTRSGRSYRLESPSAPLTFISAPVGPEIRHLVLFHSPGGTEQGVKGGYILSIHCSFIADYFRLLQKSLNLHWYARFMRPRNIAKVFSRCLILRMWQFFNSEGNGIDTPLGIDIVSCLFSDRTLYLSGVKYRSYILNRVRHNLQD